MDTIQHRTGLRFAATSSLWVIAILFASSCTRNADQPVAIRADSVGSASDQPSSIEPLSFEATAEQLLGSRLSPAEAAEGWIRLFDGYTLYGWDIAGAANWHVEDGKIVVDNGEVCLLCTSVPWQDYELRLEFKADRATNSGVFLRTPLQPEDAAVECYEINIAPDDNPFPTASVVKRKRVAQSDSEQPHNTWRTMAVRLQGTRLQVSVDGELRCEYMDTVELPAGRIGLQHNSGRVEFRDIRLRPLGLEDLLDDELAKWQPDPAMPDVFKSGPDGLEVSGGPAQLESLDTYENFVLLAQYRLASEEVNSGIFFRCIPGEKTMGYECQLSHAVNDGNPLSPEDCGSGGIFGRQDARVVAAQTDQWTALLLVVHDQSMAAWVNGLQVSNWYDDREPNENPRRGQRLTAGTMMIQAHDAETDAKFRELRVDRIGEPGT